MSISASGVSLASVLVTAYQRLFSESASPSPLREGFATERGVIPHARFDTGHQPRGLSRVLPPPRARIRAPSSRLNASAASGLHPPACGDRAGSGHPESVCCSWGRAGALTTASYRRCARRCVSALVRSPQIWAWVAFRCDVSKQPAMPVPAAVALARRCSLRVLRSVPLERPEQGDDRVLQALDALQRFLQRRERVGDVPVGQGFFQLQS